MKSNLFLKICLLGIMYIPLETKAQVVKYTITYDSKTKHYSRCAKGEENLLSPIDKVNMRPFQEEKSYTIKVLANGDRETTIFHIKSEQFGNDIPIAAKTIIDKNGVSSYASDGKRLSNIPHSPLYLEHYRAMKTGTASESTDKHGPDFKRVTATELNDIRNQGGKVKDLPNRGGYHLRKGDDEILYDTISKSIENRTFQGTTLKYSSFQKFKPNSAGKIIPVYKKEINLNKTEKGKKLWDFKEEEIINYTVIYSVNGRSVEEIDFPFNVFPNPTTKDIQVRLPRSVYEKIPTIFIYDMFGKVVFQKTVNTGLETINTESYAKGVYLLQVDNSVGDKLSQKFVKQ